jgi:RNA polymerase sigma-70 factor (ECF subfamily)
MNTASASMTAEVLTRLLAGQRAKLHRYCARMVGSAIDGEDVLQDAMLKAVDAFKAAGAIENPEGWLFRIAHNTALDFLRRRPRLDGLHASEEIEMVADPLDEVDNRQVAAASLRTFMRLPVAQRASVILMDVLGCSLQEVCDVMNVSLPAAKAALHRGRTRLRELANEPDDAPQPVMAAADRVRLASYIERFNAREFDAIRGMLADDVQLELVNRAKWQGKAAVSGYFGNYAKVSDWQLVPGLVEGHPAVLVFDPRDRSERPVYFMLLGWTGDRVMNIRDFRYAAYAMECAEWAALPQGRSGDAEGSRIDSGMSQ